MFTVTVSEKDGQQSTFNFDKAEVSIGRVKGNDIVLPKGNVSKRHSRIVVKDAKFIVIDLKSTNGTYVNGRKINSPQVIKEADKVYIGDFVLTVVGEAGASASISGSMGGMSSSGIPQMKPPAPPAPPLGGGPPPLGPRPTPTLQSTPAVGALGRPGPPQPPMPLGPPRPVGPPRGPIAPPQPPQPPRLGGPTSPGIPSQVADIGADAPTPQPMQAVQPDQRATQPGLQAHQPPAQVDTPQPVAPVQPPTPQAAAPAGPAAVMAAGALAVPLSTPGAAAVPTPPDFVSRFDPTFAEAQIQVGEAFFASVDPLQLPTFYPPAPEDREQYEPVVQDILAQVGRQDMFDHLLSEVIGLGPLEDLLDDPSIEEIYVNSHDQLLYRQHGQIVAAERGYTHPDFLYLAAQRLLSNRTGEGEPMMDEVRFSDGTRVTILMPPLAPRGPVLTVRKAPAQWRTLEDLVHDGTMNSAMAEFLGYAIEAGRSIVIGGAPRSGRLEVLNALGNLIPDGTRIVTIEDSASLRLAQHSAVSLEMGSGPQSTYDMRYLIRAANRMQPERLLVHPLRSGAAYDWVSAAAGGAQGSMAVCNGSSAHDVLGALEALCISGAPEASVRGLREQIARAVQLVVVMRRLPGGAFRVHQIAEVVGLDLNTFRVSEIFAFHNDAQGGYFQATGYTPRFYDALQAAGIPADTGIFRP